MTDHAAIFRDYQPFDAPDGWASATDVALATEPFTCVTFEMAGQIFAVDVSQVREILDMQPISRLPNAPGDLLGMIDVRGEGIALVDLASRLGVGGTPDPDQGRIIVFEFGQAENQVAVGVIADKVLSVVDLTAADVEPAPRTMVRWQGEAVRGVTRIGGQIVLLLSLDLVFDAQPSDAFDFS